MIVKLVYWDENNTEQTVTANDTLPEQLPEDAVIKIYVKVAEDVLIHNGKNLLWGQVKQYYDGFNCIFKNEAGIDIPENDNWFVADICDESGKSLLDPMNQTLTEGSTLVVYLKSTV